jgi:flavodoxin
MTVCIILSSYSGITRTMAEKAHKAYGGNLIEIKSRTTYNTLTVYAIGGKRAMRGEGAPIETETTDVSAYDW